MLPGFEIFYLTIANNLKSKNESIVAIVHYIFISNGLRCIGLSEQFEENARDLKGSEFLPENWNANEFYILRYVDPLKKNLLLLKIIPSDSILLINVLLKNKDQIFATTINPNKLITDDYKKISKMFVNDNSLDNLVKEIEKEILDKFEANEKPEKQKIARGSHPKDSSLLIDQPRQPYVFPLADRIMPSAPNLFPQVGGADLDPLGRGLGGGMIMDPRSLENNFNDPLHAGRPRDPRAPLFDPSTGLERPLLPGAVPPGSRFEHFGPPIPPSSRGPNLNRSSRHQDLQPPGYDDMFM